MEIYYLYNNDYFVDIGFEIPDKFIVGYALVSQVAYFANNYQCNNTPKPCKTLVFLIFLSILGLQGISKGIHPLFINF